MTRTRFLLFLAIATTCVLGVKFYTARISAGVQESLPDKQAQSFDNAAECSIKTPDSSLEISLQSNLARIAGQLIVVRFDGDAPTTHGVKQVTRHLAEGLISGVLLLGLH